jgi:hypothetical protein
MAFLMLLNFAAFSQRNEFRFDTQSEKEGFLIQRSDVSTLSFSYSIPAMIIDEFESNGFSGQVIELNGINLPADAGAPNLPASSRFVAIPNGAKASLKINSLRKQVLQNIDLLPAAEIPLGDDDSPLQYIKDQSIYSKDGFYPAEPFKLSETTSIRGIEVVMAGITPFQYNPVTKELIVYYDINAEIIFEGGNGYFGDDRLRSRWWDPILMDNIINSSVLPQIDYSKRSLDFFNSREEGCEYLIIVPNSTIFAQWADSIKIFRQHQGIITKVVNLSEVGGNTVTAIESYINNAFNTWTLVPSAVLLLGDYSTNAADGIISHTLNDHPGGYNPYISDNPFSDVSGNKLPDIVFARITAQNEQQLQHLINKFLSYERTPPTSVDFYDHPITAMGWQTERWFQLCSETVNGFWEHGLGKNPVRENAIYSGSPGGAWSSNANTNTVVNFFGPNGLNYIPSNTAHLTDWGSNATRVNNSINSGAFMLQHRDHGMETGWGEPSYTNGNMGGLTNQDLTFVMSINCLTGKFNYSSECFTEKMHRHANGALGLIAATEVSYSFVNDVYVWGAYDNMWPQFMPDFGTTPAERGILPAFSNAAGKYFLQQSNWPYNPEHKNITYNLFHHHGDAFMTVYSEVPQNLTVNHMPVLLSGMDIFEVTANEGALIALSVNDQIIGVGTGTGSVLQIPIIAQEPENQIRITVTLQNYYRYEQVIGCIPPDGAYMIYNSLVVNDENGNNNGLIDYGENIYLDIALKNVGSELAENISVTASTASPFVSMVNSTFEVGNVEPGSIVITPSALEFSVSDNIPNNQNIPFTLTITSGDIEWTSQFVTKAFAPSFNIGNFTINDTQGNGNGRLDPGETVEISFITTNNGQSDAFNATGTMLITGPFLTVTDQTQQIQQISAGEILTTTFIVEVSGGAPIGALASFGFNISAGAYQAEKMFNAKIGLILEDFESGDFSQFDWVSGGNQPWQIINQNPFAGVYSARSGTISHNQSSQMIVQYEVGLADTISFYYKVSSESGYDYLRFWVNNVKVGEWAGAVDWTKANVPVTAGIKTFKWEYMKDGSVSNGDDCGWIDDIVFPPMATTTAWAGNDLNICEGNTAQMNASATNFTSLMWTTSGTGSFNDATILNPIYTPSEADQIAGNITLTITVSGTSTITDNVILNLFPAPQVTAGSDAIICPGTSFSITEVEAINHISILWTTTGDGSFDDESLLHPLYTPGETDIANGTAVLTITLIGQGDCSNVSDALTLDIYAVPLVELGEDLSICAGSNIPAFENVVAENYESLIWSCSGDGTFSDNGNMQTNYNPGNNDVTNGIVTIYLSANSEGNCMVVTDSLLLVIHPLPALSFGIDQTICLGQETNVEVTLTGQAPWQVIMADPFPAQTIESSPFVMTITPESSTQITAISLSDVNCSASSDANTWLHVIDTPEKPDAPSGIDTVDLVNGFYSEYTIPGVENASDYQVEMDPATAGTININDLELIISWSADFRGQASLKVKASNMCGESDWSEPKIMQVISTIGLEEFNANNIRIYPNPTTDIFVLEIIGLEADHAKIRINDLTGRLVYFENLKDIGAGFSKQISMHGLKRGVYFIGLESQYLRINKKLILK